MIVIGYNQGWKTEPGMGRRNNQSFCHLPHQMLVSMIRYKATALGIEVILTEEAYTSKASFLDGDPLPSMKKVSPEPSQAGGFIAACTEVGTTS